MPDALFAHPRLAAVYDVFDGDRKDLDAYVGLVAELGANTVIDVGCGTGVLAIRLARQGRTVTGVDPAQASLAIAKSKPGAELVAWVHGDATALPSLGADLAVMTGNVAQVFLDDVEWGAALRAIHNALREDGYLAFETRRPSDRAWERWIVETATVTRDIAGIGRVEQRREVTEVALPLVSFRCTYRFASDGLVVHSDSVLRFQDRDAVEESLVANGFRVLDVRQAPDRPGCEFVLLAKRVP